MIANMIHLVLWLFAWHVGAVSTTTLSQNFCHTKQGSASVATVPTASQVATVHLSTLSIRTVVTPTTTIIPSPSSTTSTAFTTTTVLTTTSQATDIFSTTTTILASATASAYTTTTSTTISTSVATSTAYLNPTSSGFVPIFQYISSLGDTPSKRDADKLREHPLARRTATTTTCAFERLSPGANTKTYPSRVDCLEVLDLVPIFTITLTAKYTATVTVVPITNSFTVTSTISTISTVLLVDASTTLTQSTTSTLTTTLTSTLTTTTTTTSTSTTVVIETYAACASNNLLQSVDGVGDLSEIPSSDAGSMGTAVSASDCCGQCQAVGATCGGWAYVPPACFLAPPADGSCSPNSFVGTLYTGSDAYNSGNVYGNSGCGEWQYGGQFD